MAPDAPGILGLVRDSIARPRAVAAWVMGLGLPRATVLEVVALVSVIGALLTALIGGGVIVLVSPEASLTIGALPYALVLAASMVLSAAAFQSAGQLMGGRGTFDQALAVMAWLEVIALTVGAVQAAVGLLVPGTGPLLAVLGLGVLLWCLVNFVRELHGFAGLGRTLLTLMLGTVLGLVGLTVLMGLLAGTGWVTDA